MSRTLASNRMEVLFREYAGTIRANEKNVFGKEVIVTQGAGMNARLKAEMSERNGVFANFVFMNQDGLLSALHQLITGEKIQNNTDFVKYRLYDLLADPEFKKEYPNVASYYTNNELRRFQLAAKIADLFDQYQVYRSDMIEKWEDNKLYSENPAELWQRWLWGKLEIESREKIRLAVLSGMKACREKIRNAFPRISFFGISVYTQFHLEVFRQLSECTETDFYICVPASGAGTENELLETYGLKVRELLDMFPGLRVIVERTAGKTLLGHIQNAVTDNSNDLEISGEILLDDSIQVNSCYTPAREIECLYNFLLDLFARDKELRTRDILVMATDIDKYAPYIKAVFKNAPADIPIQVSGAASSTDDTIVSALEQILTFEKEDFTSEKVIGLLEQNRFRKRFNIDDCSFIRAAVDKSGIRFGWENSRDDESYYVSWSQGLEKILLGHAMLTDEEYNGTYPFSDSESSGSHDLFRLKVFAERLHSVICRKDSSAETLAEWKKWLLEEVLDSMIFRDDFSKDDRQEISSVYRALDFTDTVGREDKLPFSLFLDELKNRLFREIRESSLNTGRVTFSSPVPVRGLPHKVIAFLGLDNGIFPRRDNFPGFDLLGDKYREGDRSKKETDKYIFLETLMAAREKLYLSYIGQNVKDNSEIPPSIVVDTLMDYIERHCTGKENSELVQKRFRIRHPLHGFSNMYNDSNPRLFTYLYSPNEADIKDRTDSTHENDEMKDITVFSLLKFFEHPIIWYFNNVLGIYYEDGDDNLDETELFELDSLKEWTVKNEILKIPDEKIESYFLKGRKESKLPLKNIGRYTMEAIIEETAALKDSITALAKGRPETSIPVDVTIGSFRITGQVDRVCGRDLIEYTTVTDSLRHKVKAWIKTLLLASEEKIDASKFITKGGRAADFPVMKKEAAREILEKLLLYYLKGTESPLKFILEAGKESIKENATAESILKKFEKEAAEDEYSVKKSLRYMKKLFEEDYFKDFGDDNIREIRDIAELLNIK